jgi:hypothetical protein
MHGFRFQNMPLYRQCSMLLLVVASIAISSTAAVADDQSIVGGCWGKPVRQQTGSVGYRLGTEFGLPKWCTTPGSQPLTNHCGHSTRGCCCHTNIGFSDLVTCKCNR